MEVDISNSKILDRPLSEFWLCMYAFFLSLTWLMPNHSLPWTTFLPEIWCAGILIVAGGYVLFRFPAPVEWPGMALAAFFLVWVVLFQYVGGVIRFAGIAWLDVAYLFGFAFAVLIGYRWGTRSLGQLLDGLALAIVGAATISVGLQFYQWFSFDFWGVWVVWDELGRPTGNLSQPNQMATLLLWALLSLVWGWGRGALSGKCTFICAIYFLTGLALTQSRTAWFALAIFFVASWAWRRYMPSPKMVWSLIFLIGYFALVLISVAPIRSLLLLEPQQQEGGLLRLGSETRPMIWKIFLDSVDKNPWFGYGVGQSRIAQVSVAADHPAILATLPYAHNLFLDLIVWLGLPLGVFFVSYIVRWGFLVIRGAKDFERVILLLMVLIFLNHCMFEFPFAYSYFLFPVGMIVGALCVGLKCVPLSLGRWSGGAVFVICFSLLVGLAMDYFPLEANYTRLRFDAANIKNDIPPVPPSSLFLTNLRDFLVIARIRSVKGLDDDGVDQLRRVAETQPSAWDFYKLASALAFKHRPLEAQRWLRTMCKVVSDQDCATIRYMWGVDSKTEPDIAAVIWPY